MYPSHMYHELRDMRRARLQRKFMHLFFSHLTMYLLALATLSWLAGQVTK